MIGEYGSVAIQYFTQFGGFASTIMMTEYDLIIYDI